MKNPLKYTLPVVLFTIFLDLLGIGILVPVIPLLLGDPNSSLFILPRGYSLHEGYILLGFLTAAFPLMQFLSTPILGQLSDKYGRKPILLISLFGSALSYILFAIGVLTQNIPLLFISRIFDGITGGNVSVAQAAVADISSVKEKAKNFSLIFAAFGLGFIIGPVVGGKLSDPHINSHFNAATPFIFAGILSLINTFSILFLFNETLHEKVAHIKMEWGKAFENVALALRANNLRVTFITNFIFQAGYSFFTTYFGIFLSRRFGFNQGNIGDLFSFAGLCLVVGLALYSKFLSSKFKEYEVLRVSLIMGGAAILLSFLPTQGWGVFIIAPIFSVFVGLSQAHIPSLISNTVGEKIQGEMLGVNFSIQSLGMAIPIVLSGFIAATLFPEAVILVAAFAMIFSGVYFSASYKKS